MLPTEGLSDQLRRETERKILTTVGGATIKGRLAKSPAIMHPKLNKTIKNEAIKYYTPIPLTTAVLKKVEDWS